MQYWEEFSKIAGLQEQGENTPIVYLVSPEEFENYKPWSMKILEQLKSTMNRMNTLQPLDLAQRLYSNILPIVWRSLEHLKTHQNFLLGINGMQGCGKTTIALILSWIYETIGVSFDTISLDNFYLTFQEREAKLQKKYYWFRGPPGSHSVELITKFLQDWRTCSIDELSIPLFDKSLKQGQGDRSSSRVVNGKAKVMLFEGWMVGFNEQNEDIIREKMQNDELFLPDNSRLCVQGDLTMSLFMNKQLKQYEHLWKWMDYFIVIEPVELNFSYFWRLEAEQKTYLRTGFGMADEQVESMVCYYWKCLHPKIYLQSGDLNQNAKFILNLKRQIIDCIK